MLVLLLAGGYKHRNSLADKKLNLSLPLKPPKYTAKHARNYRLGYIVLLLGYVGVGLIPNIYDWLAEIPSFEKLHLSVGELSYKVSGKHGEDRITVIRTNSGELEFSCGAGMFGHPDCISPASEYDRLSGKVAEVWWYDQPIHLFTKQNKVVKLVVDGKEKQNYDNTVQITKRVAKSAPWLIFILLVFYTLIVAALEQNLRKGLKPSY
jgi:hypothetical protein